MSLAIITNLTKRKETPLAIYFEQFDLDGEILMGDWLPDNQINYRHKDEDDVWTLHIPMWLAKKKEFVYDEKD